jgi:hypothetical protein
VPPTLRGIKVNEMAIIERQLSQCVHIIITRNGFGWVYKLQDRRCQNVHNVTWTMQGSTEYVPAAASAAAKMLIQMID